MGTVYLYGRLIRSRAVFVPHRTLTYTHILRAQGNGDGSDNKPIGEPKSSTLGSIKNFFFGKKSESKKPKVTHRQVAPPKREGSLSAESIFADDDTAPKLKTTGRTPKSRRQEALSEEETSTSDSAEQRNPEHMQAVLDPRPQARMRWERKMITREIRRRGRLSTAAQVMRTERESLVKSHWFKTSIKKLAPLARQISGKNVDEAIAQMSFSKKKAAKDVLEHLKHAINVATVRNGMGLAAPEDSELTKGPTTVILKSGERKKVTDPSAIYIAQAWVNRGPFGSEFDHRARGRINLLRPPHTSLTVLLKEERTRIREWRDREAKALSQRRSQLWTHLPDRKIYGQSQYYSW